MARFGRTAAGLAALLPFVCSLALAEPPQPGAPPGESEPRSRSARAVFDRRAPLVAQIEVVDRGSGTKASAGTAFAVPGRTGTPATRVVTNFHVVADVVHEPERYRAVLIAPDGQRYAASLLALDVTRDLALLASEHAFSSGIGLREEPVAQGERIFALGNPYDIGLSIVEGTYNGLLGHTLVAKIHFTGSLNPGMSGGPALDGDGRLVGVNVATSGNQVSFLVPAGAVADLLASAPAGTKASPTRRLQAQIATQLKRYQERLTEAVLASPQATIRLGNASVPTQPAPFFDCWGQAEREAELRYQTRVHECATDDAIYLSRRINLIPMELRHQQVETASLSSGRFFEVYSRSFEGNHSEKWGSPRDFTRFRCHTRFVTSRDHPFKTAFCARRYLDYPGLYDVVFKAALLGRDDEGVDTALVLSAIEFENAQRLAARHLEGISWSE